MEGYTPRLLPCNIQATFKTQDALSFQIKLIPLLPHISYLLLLNKHIVHLKYTYLQKEKDKNA